MTELSDELLVAYVDGRLHRDQARFIDRVLEQDEIVAARLTALREAHGRFEAAFEAILAGELADLRSQIPAAPQPIEPANDGSGLVKIGLGTAALGLFLACLVLGWPIALPDLTGLGRHAPEQAVPMPAPQTWQDKVLGAQSLLSRSSVEIGLDSQGNRDLVSFQLGQAIGSGLKLPDLDSQGFKFVRAQLLRSGDKPLAQMLYLRSGAKSPLGLYATATGSPDSEPKLKRPGTLGGVMWSEGGISYVLAGEEDDANLLKLTAAVRSGAFLSDEAPQKKKEPLVSQSEKARADPVVTGSTLPKPATTPR